MSDMKGGAVADMKEYVLQGGRGPVVRFTGVLLAHTTVKSDNWAIYRTKGKNYILAQRSSYSGFVKDFKHPKMLVSYLQMLGRREQENKKGPRDWSPRPDFGVSEAIAKMVIEAGPEVSQYLVRDIE